MLSRLFGRAAQGAAGRMTFDELQTLLKESACVLIDVREAGEFASGRIPGAQNMPLSRFEPKALPRDRKVVLVCQSGMRSANALRQAQAAGLTNVVHYAGGVVGWRAAGGALAR